MNKFLTGPLSKGLLQAYSVKHRTAIKAEVTKKPYSIRPRYRPMKMEAPINRISANKAKAQTMTIMENIMDIASDAERIALNRVSSMLASTYPSPFFMRDIICSSIVFDLQNM
jgi:hypothetical protein